MDNIEQIMAQMERVDCPKEVPGIVTWDGAIEAQCRLDARWILDHWKEIEKWIT